MSTSLTEAAQFLEAALSSIDSEMRALQGRLHDDARNLRSVIATAQLGEADREILLHMIARMETTAETVASFGHNHRGDSNDTDDPGAILE